MCEMDFNSETNKMEIFLAIFLDDLEYAFEEEGYTNTHLMTEHEVDSASYILQSYIESHFILFENDKEVKYEILGRQISDDLSSVYIFIETDTVSKKSSFRMKNSLMHSIYDDQKNLVTINGLAEESIYLIFNSNNPFLNIAHEHNLKK